MVHKQILNTQRAFIDTGVPATLAHRRQQLQLLKTLIETERELLCEAVFKDLRRSAPHTEVLELGNSLGEIDYCLEKLEQWMKPEYAEKTLGTVLDTPMIVRDPFGCCLLISPWNFPLIMVFLPLATMLAAGNTVIIKPSEVSSNVAKALDEAFSRHFDKRSVAVVQADVEGTTQILKERYDLILYTGGTAVGRVIMKAAAEHLTPCVLELGGKCPVIVANDADIDITAKRIVWGKFMNNGQTCLAPDYILTTEDVKTKLLAALRTAVTEFYGHDCKESKDYSRIINRRHFDRIHSVLERTKGSIVLKAGETDPEDLFLPPHIIDVNQPHDDSLMKEELFGPVLPVLTMASFSDCLQFIKEREKPLAVYVFTRDENKAKLVIESTRSGAVTVNDVILHMTVDTLPFGGVGNSGFGSYHGKFGFDQFSHAKAVLKRGFFGESLATARYPPLTAEKVNQLKMLTNRRAIPAIVHQLLAALPIFVIGLVLGAFLQGRL